MRVKWKLWMIVNILPWENILEVRSLELSFIPSVQAFKFEHILCIEVEVENL
jgi:hypothetical protein